MSEPFPVTAEPGTQLATMLGALDAAEAQEREAKDLVKALKDGIKAQLTAITTPDGTPHDRYSATDGRGVLRFLRWTPSVRIDTPKLKAERPEIYAAYSKASGSWVLTVAK